MERELNDISVAIVVSDPWEFVTRIGSEPLYGKIIKTGRLSPSSGLGTSLAALVKIERPVRFEDEEYKYLVASPRHTGTDIRMLADGAGVFCAFVRIPADKTEFHDAFDLSWWRGGGRLIGTLQRR